MHLAMREQEHNMNEDLARYVDTHNLMLELFKQEPMAAPVDLETAKPIFEQLASDLSPENLHCDGERNDRQVRIMVDYYWRVWAALERIAGRKVPEDEVWTWDR